MSEKKRRKNLLLYSETFCAVSETFVYRMATGIHSHQVTVLTHERVNETEFPDANLKIVVWPRESAGRVGRAFATLKNWLRWGLPTSELFKDRGIVSNGRIEAPEIMLASFATCGVRLLPWAMSLKVPLATYLHGCDIGSWLKFRGYPKCLETLFSRGSAFIVATEFMRQRAIALGCPPEKIHKIPYSIPLLPAVPDRPGPKESGGRFRFLHVGRLHEQKGILFTIRAFAEVCKSYPAAELAIVGDGPQRQEAERLAQSLGLTGKIEFKGALPFTQVLPEFAKADTYVIHSISTADGDTEGFGVSLAEASMTELPIVATRHNGFPEVVLDGKTGFLVEERDVRGMADAMLKLASEPDLRARMGAAGRVHVRNSFAPEKVMGEYTELFSSLMAESPAR
ncbi:MAG: glycosyltransferase [Candidatus Sulfotelmatobacter sp.]